MTSKPRSASAERGLLRRLPMQRQNCELNINLAAWAWP
jgi:hypothetical protein